MRGKFTNLVSVAQLLLVSTASLALCSLSACAVSGNESSSNHSTTLTSANNTVEWQTEGSITIARRIPEPSHSIPSKVLGFAPASPTSSIWLSIDRSKGNAALYQGEKAIHTFAFHANVKEFTTLRPGNYQVVHKQRQAAWYAPSTYFTRRNLPVPPEGDRSRFLRGALGSYVLYLDEETPIHSGPLALSDIGGVRLSEMELARLYYLLPIDSAVVVK